MSDDLADRLTVLVDRLELLVPAIERALAPTPPPREVVVARPSRFVADRGIDEWLAQRVEMDARATTSTRALYSDFVKCVAAPGKSHAPRRRFVARLLELAGVARCEGRPTLRGLRLRQREGAVQ